MLLDTLPEKIPRWKWSEDGIFMMAMVMCAGEGTRLRPLTYSMPKPMVPIANKPVLEHTLENLERYGIREVVTNLNYHPKMIQSYFKDGTKWGMKIHYSIEKKIMGTAGGVKNAEHHFRKDKDGDFLVTSGDGLSDINFKNLIEFHRRTNALGTMALKKVESRFEYGVAVTDHKSRIKKFVEKPSWGDIFSNSVNTGIYVFKKKIFDYIPPKTFFDFGKQLWPLLLKKRMPIYGYEFREFWTDIGNMTEYRRASKAALDKEVRVHFPGKEVKTNIWIGERTRIGRNVRMIAPCLIGSDCIIGKNATIGAYTAIGDRSKISEQAVVKNSVLWNQVEVARKVYLDNCIIGMNGKVNEDISVFEATILDVKDN